MTQVYIRPEYGTITAPYTAVSAPYFLMELNQWDCRENLKHIFQGATTNKECSLSTVVLTYSEETTRKKKFKECISLRKNSTRDITEHTDA